VNAIERFRLPVRQEGYAEAGLPCRFPDMLPVLGYAVTLKVRSAASSGKGGSVLENPEWLNALLAIPSPRVLVLQDMDRFPGAAALIGYVQACILKTLDCVAVVTNGAVREISRIEGSDFQVFSSSLSVSQANSQVVHVGEPVQIGGLEISSGDLIHGDCHGIVRIPRELAARIPGTAAALRKKDDAIMSFCHSSDFSIEGLRDLLAE
jgi:regulator of RNase E activity RraA